ncbi:SprT family zinc-dependent metalloprotease [Streptomyces decoyicus]|uniref:M48 family metallopeptidase n=1 Tax=Streptomyces decoyicus TaxID=249567 RepID=UPI00340B7E9C
MATIAMRSRGVAEVPAVATAEQLGPVHEGPLQVGRLDIDVVVVPERSGVRLTVERDARITATVPAGIDVAQLVSAVKGRRRWIYDKLEERADEAAIRPSKEFVTGEGFNYLGRSHRLKLVDEAPAPVGLVRGRFLLRRDRLDRAEDELIAWYRGRGQAWLPGRAEPWAQRMRAPVQDIAVRRLGYRWGSCNRDGGVNIHWAVMQLPPSLVDYVLVHELAHLHRKDHSKEFWAIVSRAMPDYGARRAQLDSLGATLWLP